MTSADRFKATPMGAPWENLPEASNARTEVHLRLLMEERPSSKPVELDYTLWELEGRLTLTPTSLRLERPFQRVPYPRSSGDF